MRTLFYVPFPGRQPARLMWLGLVAGLMLHLSPSFAQMIGGLPDPAFNPKDTGMSRNPLMSIHVFGNSGVFEGKGRQYYFIIPQTPHYFTDTLWMHPGSGYVAERPFAIEASAATSSSWLLGPTGFVGMANGAPYGLRVSNFGWADCTLTQIQLMPQRLDLRIPATSSYGSFRVPKTKRFAQSRYGWEKRGDEVFLAFGYHKGPLSLLPDRLRLVRFPDSLPFTGEVEIPDFNFQQWVKTPTGLLVLGNTIANGQASQARILNLDFTFANQAGTFSNLPSNLIFENLETATLRSDGALVVAGTFRQNGVTTKGIRCFLPGGAADPAFPSLQFPLSSRSKFALNYQNELELAYSFGVYNQEMMFRRYSLTGQVLQEAPLQWDNGFIGINPELYHRGRNQWLVRTDFLTQKLDKREWFGGSYTSGQIPDSTGPGVDRIWSGPNGQVEYETKTQGIQTNSTWWTPQSDMEQATVNPFLKKMAIVGSFAAYQNRYTPGMMIIDEKGNLDTVFQGLKRFPPATREKIMTYGFFQRFLPVEQNKVLSFRGRSWWYWNRAFTLNFADSVMRWLPNGQPDPGFQPYRFIGTPLPGPDSMFYALRFSRNGQPVLPEADTLNETTTEVIKINRRGDFAGVLGSFITNADSAFIKTNFATIQLTSVDALGNVWISNAKTRPITLIRVSPQGQVRFFQSDSLAYGGNSLRNFVHISQGPSGRISLVGMCRQVVDTGMNGIRTWHVMEFDSSFQLTRKIRFDQPNGFGTLPGNQERTIPNLRLPDGKILCIHTKPNFNPNSSGITIVAFRYLRDGRLDPTFIPINYTDQDPASFFAVMGDRLYAGFSKPYSYDMNGWGVPSKYALGTSKKDGLHAFLLNSSSEEYGFLQGKVQRVIGPTSGCNPPGERYDVTDRIIKDDSTGQLALTDRQGFYSMPLKPGTFSLRQQINNLTLDKQICPSPLNPALVANLDAAGEVSMDNNFLNQGLLCPRLTMQLNMGRFRLCAVNRFSIRFGNDGLAAEPNARIRLSLPPLVKVLSASAPFTVDSDSVVTFDIGNLNPGEFRSISVVDTIGCPTSPDSTVRACFSARMEPIAPCQIVPPATLGWDGAWLDAVSRYIPTSQKIRVVLRNRGDNMADSVAYSLRKFNNMQLIEARVGKVKLAAGDSLAMLVDADEFATVGLNVNQTLNCPLGTSGSLAHFGKNGSKSYLAFWDGWLSRQTHTACPPFRFSYDPNEKLVEPSVPFVDAGTTLDYTIHFENFGNDTAFAVVVVDSLPAGVLPETFEFTGSSHPCRINLSGTSENAVLTFAFVPIKLAAKKQDSILSKGQLSFRIRLRDGLEPGSEHRNRAYIFFDRNEPIITNFAVTRITPPDVPTQVDGPRIDPNRNMAVYPNPNRGEFELKVPAGFEDEPIRVYDATGLEVKRLKGSNQGRHSLKELPAGVYYLQVEGLKTSRMVVIP